MNKGDIRAAARTITELEVTDVSDATIDLYIKDGYNRMLGIERRWPSFEATTTLTTVAGTQAYSLASIGAGDLREVTSLVNATTGTRLSWISYDQAEAAFMSSLASGDAEPRYYSVWGGSIQLWPAPDSAYQLYVRGYRKPTNWSDFDAVEIDADDRLHYALVYFAVASLYSLQEDAQMSQFYRQQFDEAVRLAHADIVRVPSQVPLVLSGGNPF